MCITCWEENGKHAILNEETKITAKLIGAVYDWDSVGGNAHIVVDDMNLEDGNIDFCIDAARNDKESPIGKIMAELLCLNALRLLTVPERYSAMAIHNGYI